MNILISEFLIEDKFFKDHIINMIKKFKLRELKYPHKCGLKHRYFIPRKKLLEHLDCEIRELKEAVSNYDKNSSIENLEAILYEAADVSNMALIVADHIHFNFGKDKIRDVL